MQKLIINQKIEKGLISAIGGGAVGVLTLPYSLPLGLFLLGSSGLLATTILWDDIKGKSKDSSEVTYIEKVLFDYGVRRYIEEEDRWEIGELLGVEELEGKVLLTIKVPEGLGGYRLRRVLEEVIKEYYKALEVKVECLGGSIYEITLLLTVQRQESDNWEDFWKTVGVKNNRGEVPKIVKKERKEEGIEYIFSLPLGVSSHIIKQKDIAIREMLDAREVEIEYIGNHKLSVKGITKSLPTRVSKSLKELIVEGIGVCKRRRGGLNVYLGESLKGSVWGNLVENPHIIIAGATNSGKSTYLKVLLLLLLIMYKKDIKMYLIDLKEGTDLTIFEGMEGVEGVVRRTVEETDEVIEEIEEEIRKRGELFRLKRVSNIDEYNRKVSVGERLPYIILTIEEYISYKGKIKRGNGEYVNRENLLAEKLFQLRAFGIYNIVTIQKLTKDCIKPAVRSSFGYRVGLKVNLREESRNYCNDESLYKLRGEGHALVETKEGMLEVQGKDISNELIYQLKR